MDAKVWAEGVSEKIKRKMQQTVARNQGKIPYLSEEGVYDDWSSPDRIGWWTNGFWGGILWQMYHATGDACYRTEAQACEQKLDAVFRNYKTMDHDSGFRWLPTAVADYRVTGNEESFERGITAANNLAGRYNLKGAFIRAWNSWEDNPDRNTGRAIIDCLMNLPLLYWASEELRDPRFSQIAESHADTVMKYFMREDGSVCHIVDFDPVTGEHMGSDGGQGMERGSSWTRGQAWALYGFILSYVHTGREKYLSAAAKTADYCISHIPGNGMIPVDFCQPTECRYQDDIAASVMACGLLELEKHAESWKKETYHAAAMRLLVAIDRDSSDWSPERDGILQNCSSAYHQGVHNVPIMYGDYFFIEAIFRLTGEDLFIW